MSAKTFDQREYARRVHEKIRAGYVNMPDGSWRPETTMDKTSGYMET